MPLRTSYLKCELLAASTLTESSQYHVVISLLNENATAGYINWDMASAVPQLLDPFFDAIVDVATFTLDTQVG